MKIGQAVRVIARESGHRFAIGEIVYRTPAPGDDEYDLEFKNSSGKVCYMDDDEYEFVDLTEEDTPRPKTRGAFRLVIRIARFVIRKLKNIPK
jgi:hypothetical protein